MTWDYGVTMPLILKTIKIAVLKFMTYCVTAQSGE